MNQVPMGMEPNEHGTWYYGRDGWCDGQQVSPWVIDITADVGAPGDVRNSSVSYVGLFNGSTPDPSSNPGVIIMYSHLVFYGPPDAL